MIKKWINKIKPWLQRESGKFKYVFISAFFCTIIFVHVIIPSAAEKSGFIYGLGYFFSLLGIYLMRMIALFIKGWLEKQDKQMA